MKMETPIKPRTRARKEAPAATRWHGAVEGLHDGLVYGWALDAERPNARVVLELCLNDEPLRSVIADVVRTDHADKFHELSAGASTDPCHGFIADIGDENLQGSLTVRVANSAHVLDGAIALEAESKPPVAATSNVFGNGTLRLTGWAVDTRNAKRTVTVSAYVGSKKVASAQADRALPFLRGKDIGPHGFALDLPLELGDGQLHEVRVVDDAGLPINGSPVSICTFADGLRALLPTASDGLLDNVVDSYERHLPRSVGIQHYQEWTRRFAPQLPASASKLAVGLIVAAGDGAAVAATLESVKRQSGARVLTFPVTAKHAFHSQLTAAIAAGCDVIGCIRAGDTLSKDALALALGGFDNEKTQLIYTDSEHAGKPWFKPAWNRDYAYGTDYPLELLLVRTAGQGPAAEARKWEAMLATQENAASFAWSTLLAAAALGNGSIVHVPHVLYQFNSALTPQELAARASACETAAKAAEPKLEFTQTGNATALFQPRRIRRKLTKAECATAVSLIIPTRDYADMLERCITSISQHTDWPNLEIIVIDNGSTEAKTKTYFRSLAKQGVKVLAMPGPFNFADLNNRAVEAATGEIVGLINNDIEALHAGWLDEIIGQLLRPGVGAVGAKLLWPNGMVQHGGVLMGVGNAAGHFGNLLADADYGDYGRNQLVQQVTGVTAACLFIRRADYLELGGMDADAFPVAFNDVDLCLKVRASGKAIAWTPFAKLLHAESASRGDEDSPQKLSRARRELEYLRKRWGNALLRDPAYHPSLNLDIHGHAFGALAMPPRDRAPRTSIVHAVIPAKAGIHAEPAQPKAPRPAPARAQSDVPAKPATRTKAAPKKKKQA